MLIAPGVHAQVPGLAGIQGRERDAHILPVGVHGHVYQVVRLCFQIVACEADGERLGIIGDIDLFSVDAVGEERFHAADGVREHLADDGMPVAVGNHEAEEFEQIPVLLQQAPIQPGDLIVLAVGVVVAELGVAELVTGQEHGRPAAAHEHGAGVADHAETEAEDFRVVGIALSSAVPAAVVIGAVRIVPAVPLVVLLVIGIEIVEGKAVMAGEEIHAGIVACVVIVVVRVEAAVEVAGAGDAPGGLPGMPVIPLQEAS